MTATGWAWLSGAGILAVLDWLAVARGARPLERIAKPLVMVALLGAALASSPTRPGVQGWLVAALALGLAGDVALVAERPAGGDPDAARPRGGLRFALGLAAFLLGHLSYLRAMVRYGTDQVSIVFGLVLVLIAVLTFGYRILAGAQTAGGNGLTVGVTLYMVVLGSAVVLGVGTEQLWIAAGAVLFGVSDLVLASDRFVRPWPGARMSVIVTYHLAQALLLLGLVS
ncbi:MAG TPA: lysoplasmalogenase family protein [Jatrophihabitans sp.]|nr:lysoplasmalogenase family protein [Jatrophihabitans sp.]